MGSLIGDGIVPGVGAVVMFLPNIIILFIGIALLETTGYMSRVAFLLDGFFHRFGLHGKSFYPSGNRVWMFCACIYGGKNT